MTLDLAAHVQTDPHPVVLGVDVGGTFTDAALIAQGRSFTAKVATTPSDQSQGVIAAVEAVLDAAGIDPSAVARFAHGMTVATNALLEQRGARTALIATSGFEDVIELGRQTRADLYRLCQDRPQPLVPAELRFGVAERSAPAGVVKSLDPRQLAQIVEQVVAAEVESVAICLLHSYAHPQHERALQQALVDASPRLHVSSSSELLPVFREYERSSTTVIDAYLSPLLAGYLDRLLERCAGLGLPAPEVMQSSGGLVPAADAARHASWMVLSGPAGGVAGAALSGARAGERELISFDMGGTSCDVAVIENGRLRQGSERTIAGRVLALPMADIETVGAGGGSVGWADAGGALRVGPRSAGAEPGPACYGRGGNEPTVTDANLALGYLGDGSDLADGLRLDAGAAQAAIASLAEQLDLDIEQTASGILRVADEEMLRALQVVTVERGIDPRDYTLVAFGGAGPMHAARIAGRLGIRRVLCPHAAGVLSALGLASSDRRRDFVHSVLLSGDELNQANVEARVAELSQQALAAMSGAELEVGYDLRYLGQAFELPIDHKGPATPRQLRTHFDEAHSARYGYADPQAGLELVNIRVRATAGRTIPALGSIDETGSASSLRRAMFDGHWLQAQLWRGLPAIGSAVDGPAIVELADATVVVPPGWRATTDECGTVALERE